MLSSLAPGKGREGSIPDQLEGEPQAACALQWHLVVPATVAVAHALGRPALALEPHTLVVVGEQELDPFEHHRLANPVPHTNADFGELVFGSRRGARVALHHATPRGECAA
jgi:hypothetical protein